MLPAYTKVGGDQVKGFQNEIAHDDIIKQKTCHGTVLSTWKFVIAAPPNKSREPGSGWTPERVPGEQVGAAEVARLPDTDMLQVNVTVLLPNMLRLSLITLS